MQIHHWSSNGMLVIKGAGKAITKTELQCKTIKQVFDVAIMEKEYSDSEKCTREHTKQYRQELKSRKTNKIKLYKIQDDQFDLKD